MWYWSSHCSNSPEVHWRWEWWRSNCTGQQLACFRNLIESKSSLVESNVFNRNRTHQIRRLQGHLRATMVHQHHHLPPLMLACHHRTAAAELFACIWLTKSKRKQKLNNDNDNEIQTNVKQKNSGMFMFIFKWATRWTTSTGIRMLCMSTGQQLLKLKRTIERIEWSNRNQKRKKKTSSGDHADLSKEFGWQEHHSWVEANWHHR